MALHIIKVTGQRWQRPMSIWSSCLFWKCGIGNFIVKNCLSSTLVPILIVRIWHIILWVSILATSKTILTGMHIVRMVQSRWQNSTVGKRLNSPC